MTPTNLGEAAKETLVSLARECDVRLEKYWDLELGNNFGFNESQKELVKEILLHAKEHNLRFGKRIRAAFVYYGYLLGQVVWDEKVWKAAEAVEIVHTALLMHDDFMDRDKTRRGGPTTQVVFANGDGHYGDSMAINIGDAVLCMGFERLLGCGVDQKRIARAMSKLLRGITHTVYGQSYDMSLPKMGGITEEKIMSLHKAKTAIYTYENPLFIGGILANLSEEVLQILSDYSMDGGIAFQIQDDILGVFGNETKTGKSANSDIIQGKATLLTVKVMEWGTSKQKKDFVRIWGNNEANEEEIELVKKIIIDCGSYKYSVDVARKFAQEAVHKSSLLRSLKLNKEAIDFLEGIALYMVNREM